MTVPARAASPASTSAAEALFSEARGLLQRGNFAEACPKFEESERLDPGMGTEFYLAKCWEQIGKTASAWAMFRRVASEARAAGLTERAALATSHASALERKLSKLQVDVEEPDPALAISRDSEALGRASWGVASPVDPGEYEIQAQQPGKKSFSKRVQIPATPGTVTVLVPKLVDETASASTVATPPPATRSVPERAASTAIAVAPTQSTQPDGPTAASRERAQRFSKRKAIALGIGGVGLIGTAAGIYFNVQFNKDLKAADTACPTSDNCSVDTYHSARDQAKTDRGLALAGYAIGGTALATALVMYLTAPSEPAERTAWRVLPNCSPRACGASLSSSW